MDHETLLIGLIDARTRMADRPCPWCGMTNWSEGVLTDASQHSINADGNVAFVYQGGAPAHIIISALFTCQDCGYQVAFALRRPAA